MQIRNRAVDKGTAPDDLPETRAALYVGQQEPCGTDRPLGTIGSLGSLSLVQMLTSGGRPFGPLLLGEAASVPPSCRAL